MYKKLVIVTRKTRLQELVERFKQRFATLPLRQLIRYVYQRYPDYTDKSLIRKDILGG